MPDRNVEYLFYQALFGAWPPALALDDDATINNLADRMENADQGGEREKARNQLEQP